MPALNDLAIRLLITATDQTGPAVRSTTQGIGSISTQLQSLQTIATRFLDFKLFAGWAQDTIKLSDTYKGLTGRLQQVTSDTDELTRVQDYLFNLSQRTQTGLVDTVTLYTRTSQALKKYANGQEKAAQLTEVVNLSFKAQSSSAEQISSTVTQLTQAIGGASVEWEDFGEVSKTNLLLTNIAAKNLGFDGITSLKKAMSAGQISGIQLTDALIAGFEEVKAAADKMPVSVEAAWTTLNNTLLRYIGESDNASSATQKLSSGIQLLANNIEPLIQTAVLLAEIYAVKMVAGLLAAGKAYFDNAQATQKAALAAQFETEAQQRNVLTKQQLLSIQVKISENALKNAQAAKLETAAALEKAKAIQRELLLETEQIALKKSLAAARVAGAQVALKDAQFQRQSVLSLTDAKNKLALAQSNLNRVNAQSTIYNGELSAATDTLSAAQTNHDKATQASTDSVDDYKTASSDAREQAGDFAEGLEEVSGNSQLAEKAMQGVNNVMSLMLAFEVGTTIGEWLNGFEAVRVAGSYMAETFVVVASNIEGLINAESFSQQAERIKKIHADFDQVREADTDSARQHAAQQSETEEGKAKAAEKSAQRQKVAYEKIKTATAELTAIIDANAKRQAEKLAQQLKDSLQAIEETQQSENQKQQARFDLMLEFAEKEIQLQKSTLQDKLALIDHAYADELEKTKDNKERLAQVETEKRQAKLSVYTGLAKFYGDEVNRLRRVYADEINAAQQSRDALASLAQNHEKNLFDIKLGGLDKRDKLYEQEKRFNQLVAQANKEIAKGQQGDQGEINRLLTEARGLHGSISSAAGKGSAAIFDAKKRENTLYDAQKTVLENNAAAHEKNAGRAKTALQQTKVELQQIQTTIDEITGQLSRDLALSIAIDSSSLRNAQSIIAQLTAPATKTITIVTKNAPQEAQNGGPIHGFNQGGFAPRAGKLTGFGGGDKVKALLEAGEFIIRKEAVQKLGLGFLQQVNAGQAPDQPIKRAEGGPVGLDKIRAQYGQQKFELMNMLKILINDKRRLKTEFDRNLTRRRISVTGFTGRSYADADIARNRAEWKLLNDEIQNVIKKLQSAGSFVSVIDGIAGGDAGTGRWKITAFLDNVALFNKGGLVPGTGNKDSVPAMLTPGEYILKKTAVNALGADFVTMLNNGIAPQIFASSAIGNSSGGNTSSEKIDISLNIGGARATGRFDDNSNTQAFLDEMRQSGMVST